MSKDNPTVVDQLLDRLKNNKILALIIVFALVVIGLGSFTDALGKLGTFLHLSQKTENKDVKSVKKAPAFDNDTLARIRSQTSVSLESVQPSPDHTTISPNQTFAMSAIVNYSFPEWVDAVELNLEVNRDPENGRFWHSMTEKRITESRGRVQLSGVFPEFSATDLKGYRVKIKSEVVLFDNESGRRHVIVESSPVYFEVKN